MALEFYANDKTADAFADLEHWGRVKAIAVGQRRYHWRAQRITVSVLRPILRALRAMGTGCVSAFPNLLAHTVDLRHKVLMALHDHEAHIKPYLIKVEVQQQELFDDLVKTADSHIRQKFT